ncbi:hypothetical protein BH09PSE5_BH09PSE5_19700 [soil metagenome]
MTSKLSLALSVVAASAALLLAGRAATSGMGGGEMKEKGGATDPVLFSWASSNSGVSGGMTAALPNSTYQGTFVHITSQTTRESLLPMWSGWSAGWSDWPYRGPTSMEPIDTVRFLTPYSGKVVANLQSDSGKRMRCRLLLLEPSQGTGGGGKGECQIAGGNTTRATF